jgi:hypothetical protein
MLNLIKSWSHELVTFILEIFTVNGSVSFLFEFNVRDHRAMLSLKVGLVGWNHRRFCVGRDSAETYPMTLNPRRLCSWNANDLRLIEIVPLHFSFLRAITEGPARKHPTSCVQTGQCIHARAWCILIFTRNTSAQRCKELPSRYIC